MKRDKAGQAAAAAQLRDAGRHPFTQLDGYVPLHNGETALYRAIREGIPVVDAAICKLVRLCGGVTVTCRDKKAQEGMERFLRAVPTGRGQRGLQSFLDCYLDSMLTCGRAVGEMVPAADGRDIAALLCADAGRVEIREGDSPLDFALCVRDSGGKVRELERQELLLFTPFQPETGAPYGVSMLRSMPFLAEVLLKIFEAIGKNWERTGNVRFAVVCKGAEGSPAEERCRQVAREWSAAMQAVRDGAVRDFVCAGDVEIRAIGADNQILDSEAPVRQILEQLVAKTGIPPFLLGLSWSSTERMSSQQADIMTSEIAAIRRSLEPVVERICEMWLRLKGFDDRVEICWTDESLITLEEIYQGLAAEFQTRTGKTAGSSSELAVRFYAVAAQIYSLYVQGEWTRRQCFPQTATGEDLDKHAQLRNVTRRQAARATGTVRFYVGQPQETETEIPEGTVCMTAAGVRFLTTQTAVVEADAAYAEAPVVAGEAGAAGNVGANTIVFMALPPVRIVACANPELLVNGLDEEGDEELRERVLATYQRLANGANNAFYRQAAMSFDEVAAVTVLPRYNGVGTVGVVPAAQGGIPGEELLEKMQAYFDQVREIACEVKVFPPEVENVDLELKLWAREDRDFDTVADSVKQTLTDWFNGERLGQPLLRAQLTSLVFGVDGVANCEFVKPAADLPLDSKTLPVLNDLKLVKGEKPDAEPKAATVGQRSGTGNGEEADSAEN